VNQNGLAETIIEHKQQYIAFSTNHSSARMRMFAIVLLTKDFGILSSCTSKAHLPLW
jgi:hypothetical protein